MYRDSTFYEDTASSWTELGNDLTIKAITLTKRGRVGLIFIVSGFLFMLYGANALIYMPSKSEETEILEKKKRLKKKQLLEMDEEEREKAELLGMNNEEPEDQTNIRNALSWKRRHFFINLIYITMFLMVKFEFSYTKIFSRNIKSFLILFMFMDIVLEQLLTRQYMDEALLVSPILGAFVVTEFIMTMAAEDLKAFIVSYFIESCIVIFTRIYLNPFVEHLEAWTQMTLIRLSIKYKFVKRLFGNILRKQLATTLQLMSLNEYRQRKLKPEDEAKMKKKRILFDFQREKGEGMEALLGSVNSYASQTQALIIIPVTLLLIMWFANETKIPQNYDVRIKDIQYYLTFTICIILPQLIQDVFVLHIIDIVHGYKMYDYLTYCDYRFKIRQVRWLNRTRLDKSILHSFRSLDQLCFSSQFYYVVSISTWGIVFLYLGLTAMIRNYYNPFADPALLVFVVIICSSAIFIGFILNFLSIQVGLWALTIDHRIRFDDSDLNKLDAKAHMNKMIRNIQTNPFRHKFVVHNKEWIIENIASILGGRQYQKQAGAEFDYLRNVYQAALNHEHIQRKLNQNQQKLEHQLKLMPYNQERGEDDPIVYVSDDAVSDLPENDWQLPDSLAKIHIYKLTKMWLDWARQNLRLKSMVSDIVMRNKQKKCKYCHEKFRLQVIQKKDFNNIAEEFRSATVGIPFSKARWRRFYQRRQVFITLCMECAFMDNLQQAQLQGDNEHLRNLIQTNSLKHVGRADIVISKKIQLPHIKFISINWLWKARASLLHRDTEKEKMRKQLQIDAIEARRKLAIEKKIERFKDKLPTHLSELSASNQTLEQENNDVDDVLDDGNSLATEELF